MVRGNLLPKIPHYLAPPPEKQKVQTANESPSTTEGTVPLNRMKPSAGPKKKSNFSTEGIVRDGSAKSVPSQHQRFKIDKEEQARRKRLAKARREMEQLRMEKLATEKRRVKAETDEFKRQLASKLASH